ncbi:tRNA (adenosine(37)-N6)-threonylcarbamoyltransferase complex transferase subunit TsaD, partial [Candidatus Omnitrophota bacterium]
MKILGIETSCDETAASIVENGTKIRSNVVASSLKEHKKYGGIIPEIASRRQLEYINPVVDEALTKARFALKKIDAIAVTSSPGLIGSLLVGTSFAKALSYATGKPLIEVDHIKAHLYASFLTEKIGKKKELPTLPAIGLVVSGGHTSLYFIRSFKQFKLLGHTLDDAAGEAYDKVARLLNLGYPGGPAIDKLAQKGSKSDIQFTAAPLPKTLNFSYSGIKTAVLYYKQKHENNKNFSISNIAFAFQTSIVNNLTKKSIEACLKHQVKTLVVGGGVAANSGLRKQLTTMAAQHNIKVHFPSLPLCMDNAAMIAGFGYHFLKTSI